MRNFALPNNYQTIVSILKEKIRQARQQAALKLNADLLSIYHQIGCAIAEQETKWGWGAKVVDRLSRDLRAEFEDMRGLSPRNLRYMRDFSLAYPQFPFLQGDLAKLQKDGAEVNENSILQGELAKLSWYHHITLLDKAKDPGVRQFYIRETIKNGWSRDVMVHQIEAGLHKAKGQLIHNFDATTTHPGLISQVFKDPYMFDFIFLGNEAKERDLENALIAQLMKLLLELGQYFAFMGKQYRLHLKESEYFVDLLFYHTKLKRYIVIELKIGDFRPEFIGQMSFYLSLADEQLRDGRDEKSIGLILCKTKDGLVAEYALRDTNKAIGIAQYKVHERLPENIQGELPSIEEIEKNMAEELKAIENPTKARMDRLMKKLALLQGDEVKTPVTPFHLSSLFDHSVRPLFDYLLTRLEEFSQYFISESHYWLYNNNAAKELDELGTIWKNERHFRVGGESNFGYRLSGFKKAGVETFDVSTQVFIQIDEYFYGIRLLNSNNNQPFIRKLYDHILTEEELQNVGDMVCKALMDQIEWHIDRISTPKKEVEIG
jgi:predicted nuclease of restriction endonuclease-like (RecB) superfamily